MVRINVPSESLEVATCSDEGEVFYVNQSECHLVVGNSILENEHAKWISTLRISPSATYLAGGDSTGSIRFWDLRSDTRTECLTKQPTSIHAVGVTPNNEYWLTGDDLGRVCFWHGRSGTLRQQIHISETPVKQFAFIDSDTVLCVTKHELIKLSCVDDCWSVFSLLSTLYPIECFDILGDNCVLATLRPIWGTEVVVWSLESQNLLGYFEIDNKGLVLDVTILQEGSQCLTICDYEAYVFDWKRQQKKRIQAESRSGHFRKSTRGGRTCSAYLVSENAAHVYTYLGDEVKPLKSLYGVWPLGIVLSPQERWLAVDGGFYHYVNVYDIKHKTCWQFQAHSGFITGMAFTHDERFLLTSSTDGTIKIWNTKDWSLAADYRILESDNEDGQVHWVAVKPDQTFLGDDVAVAMLEFHDENGVVPAEEYRDTNRVDQVLDIT